MEVVEVRGRDIGDADHGDEERGSDLPFGKHESDVADVSSRWKRRSTREERRPTIERETVCRDRRRRRRRRKRSRKGTIGTPHKILRRMLAQKVIKRLPSDQYALPAIPATPHRPLPAQITPQALKEALALTPRDAITLDDGEGLESRKRRRDGTEETFARHGGRVDDPGAAERAGVHGGGGGDPAGEALQAEDVAAGERGGAVDGAA